MPKAAQPSAVQPAQGGWMASNGGGRTSQGGMVQVGQQRNPTVQQTTAQQSTSPSLAQTSANAFNGAVNGTQQAMNYQPMQIRAGQVNAGQISNANLSEYMNPYTDNVINTTMNDMRRSNRMALNDAGAAATAAGAFGGDRHGLVEGQTNNGFAQQVAQMSSGLRQSGYQNAQQMAQSDIDRRLNAGQFNSNQSVQVQQANQNAGLSGASFRLGAAGQLGNLGNLGFGMGQQITQTQSQQGAQQQALMQQLIDAAKAQYGGWTGAPKDALATNLAATNGAPYSSSTTTSQKPGLLNLLSAGISLI